MVVTFNLCCSLYKYPIFPLLVGSLGGHSFGVGLNSFFLRCRGPLSQMVTLICVAPCMGTWGPQRGFIFGWGLLASSKVQWAL
jgi:hypothetical protein